jgi:anti-sigma factor RsiW
MNVDFVCGSERAQAALAAYLYRECDAAERAAVEAHLAICDACAAELASLGATRSALASWAPPETELGFRIVSERDVRPTATVLRPTRWWQRPLPAWAQAAAAIVIFAAGGLLGMRAGTTDTAAPAPVVASAPVESAGTASSVSAQDLAALEQRLRREMNGLRTAAQPAPVATQAAAVDEQVIQRVRALLAESEQRQEREMSIRLAQVLRDVDTQRRMDLVRIEDTFGQMEGITGAELRQQRQAIDYLRQVSFPVQRQRPQ